MPPILRLLRPGDWVKNVFVLVPAIFSLAGRGRSLDAATLLDTGWRTAAAFALFSALASGFYAINDALDAESDRRHPVKRRRPVASGAVSVRTALTLGGVLIVVSIALGFALAVPLGIVLAAYAVLQASYNARLKRVILVDVIALATGFCLRAVAGGAAIGVPISIWLLLCVFFLTLFLGFVKRLCDLASAKREAVERGDAEDAAGAWRSPAGYDDRLELNWLLAVSAVLTVTTYLMYALSAHARSLFGEKAVGFGLLVPFVLVSIHRFYRRANAGLSDSPLDALRSDRAVLASVLGFGLGVIAILYVPAVGELIESLVMLEGTG